MRDVLKELATGALSVYYHNAEQGKYIDELLKAANLGVRFDGIFDIDADDAKKFPYYYVAGNIPSFDKDPQHILERTNRDTEFVDFDDFFKMANNIEDEAEELSVDISAII